MSRAKPRNTDPPHIPQAKIYDTHRPAEWIAITDSVYSDVVNGSWLEGYRLSFVGLESGKLWVHIQTEWERYE